MQSRQRFLHQLGDVPVQYQSTAPQGGSVQDGGTNQIVLNLSKQYTDKQGWEAAELAPRAAARQWLPHRAGVEVFDVRPPTRIAGREELQVVAQIASSTYDRALRASGIDGVMTRPFYTTEEEKNPLPPCAATSGFHTGCSLAEDVMAGKTCLRSSDDTCGTRCKGKKQQTSRR